MPEDIQETVADDFYDEEIELKEPSVDESGDLVIEDEDKALLSAEHADDSVVDFEDIFDSEIKKTSVTYKGSTFSVHYRREAITPGLMVMGEDLSQAGKEQERITKLNKVIDAKAKAYQQKHGGKFESAREKVLRANPEMARNLQPSVRMDMRATSRALADLVSWQGLKGGGVLIPPNEEFFLRTSFEFQAAYLHAILEHYSDPTSESGKDSSSTSSTEEGTDTARSATS